MCAEKARLRNSVSDAYIEESTKLRAYVNLTLSMAHEQVARSREIVARSCDIVFRTRRTLACSGRIQQGLLKEESRNPIMDPHYLSESDLEPRG